MRQYAMTQSTSSSNQSTPSQPPRSADEKLSVAVRIRPLRHNEHQRIIQVVDDKTCVLEEDSDNKNDVLRQKRGGERHYTYDSAFGEDSTQEEVYVATSRVLVSDVLNGYNATVFAYGATGSGKTYTMVGTPEQPGIMVRALNDLFLAVHHSPHPETYAVTMSYLEIYNENIRDLLNPGSGFLELREDSRGRNIKVAGLTEISTISTQEVMHLLQKGNKARTVEPTAANKTSSRSHALLSVTVRQSYSIENNDKIRSRLKQGKLFMIDLAGSERASNTKNRGKRLQEGAHINRSLLALGNCINALSGGARYVNYRDSKLTRLLKDALSGNCRTVMIAHVSPASVHREESRTTLLYADRAKNISKKVERNVLDVSYHISQYRNIINELRQEISRLRTKMSEERPRSIETNNRHGEQLKIIREQIISTFREQMKLRRQLMELDGQLLGLGAEAERQHLLISQWESMNNKLYGHTSSGWRPSTDPGFDTDRDISDSESADSALQQAWAELSFIEKEQERCLELRAKVERELEEVRQKAVRLEEELPTRISSADEREVLALICRVHELEADKVALQSERLVKQHELRRRDLVILRFDRQRQICEEIITRQRQLMEDTYAEARLNLRDAEYTSDLASDVEKRRVKRRKTVLSGEESSEEEDTSCHNKMKKSSKLSKEIFPPFPPTNIFNNSGVLTQPSSSNSNPHSPNISIDSFSPLCSTYSTSSSPIREPSSLSIAPIRVPSLYPSKNISSHSLPNQASSLQHTNLSLISNSALNFPLFSNAFSSQATSSHDAGVTSQDFTFSHGVEPPKGFENRHMTNLQSQVADIALQMRRQERRWDILMQYVTDMASTVKKLEEKVDQLIKEKATVEPEQQNDVEVLGMLPISSLQQFSEFEKCLKENTAVKKNVLNLLVNTGGKDMRHHINNMLRRLLEDSFAQNFSMSGKSTKNTEKIAFVGTQTCYIMYQGSLKLPPDLQELYRIYQQEIHAGTYPDYTPFYQSGSSYSSYIRDRERDRLPPITQSAEPLFQRSLRFSGADGGLARMDSEISLTTPISSAGSEYGSSPLPPIVGQEVPGRPRRHPPPAVLFPPILGTVKDSSNASRSDVMSNHLKNGIPNSRLPRPLPKHSAKSLRRTASDDNLITSAGKIRTRSNWEKQ